MHPVANSKALDLADVSDEALVKSAKAGNERAFEELVRGRGTNLSALRSVIFGITRTPLRKCNLHTGGLTLI